ncbi:hypothetical protein ACLEPN_30620 [Myxococcus sp. 1LA]
METSPTPPAQPSQVKKLFIGLAAIAGLALVAGGAVAVAAGTVPMGWMRTTDVGQLPELAAVQAQLSSLDACEMQYGSRRRANGVGSTGSKDMIRVEPCGTSSAYGISVWVPLELQVSGVAFNMKRGSVKAPWKILIEKEQTAFPALKQSLEQLTPLLLTQYPIERQRDTDERAQSARDWAAHKDAERARKEAAKNSYPE